MAKELTSKTFVIDYKRWFEGNFGFMPTQEELENWFEKEEGVAPLLLSVFSENYLQWNVKQSGKRFKKGDLNG